MKKNFLLFILIIIVCTSCIKYHTGSYSVKGTVRYDSTGSPAQGVTVNLLLAARQAKGQSASTVTKVKSTETDSNGEYIIYYKKSRGWEYSYSVQYESNYPYGYSAGYPLDQQNSIVDLSIK